MKDFEETQGLDDSGLAKLLADGDARDRVFAIWALALRSTAATSMANQLRSEPDAGVRRALAVVLAANGELDLVVAMSRHDPSPLVRASAVQMVVRFAAAGRVPWSLVAERFADVTVVRASVVSQVGPEAPADVRALVVGRLEDEDESVRREAFETCAKLAKAGVLPRDRLREALDGMREGECKNALVTWFANDDLDVIATALAVATVLVRKTAADIRPELVQHYLDAYVDDDVELLRELRASGKFALADVSLEVLVPFATRSGPDLWIMMELTERLRRLDQAPIPLRPGLLGLARLFETKKSPDEAESNELALSDDDPEADWEAEWVRQETALRSELSRLLGQ